MNISHSTCRAPFAGHQALAPKRAIKAFGLIVSLFIAIAAVSPVHAQVSKGHRILIHRGLQTQGMATKDDVFHLATYENANYSTINWLWESNTSLHGAAPGYPWARWVGDETMLPAGAESPFLNQLVTLQLGDEWNLNDSGVRDRAVNWFNAVRSQWPNTILYMNSFGGQVNDASLGDFITRAKPDMLSFDAYPFKSDYATHVPNSPAYGSPTHWYNELRRYRVHALNADLPLAIYRQTFHSIQDYDQTEYRSPSPSEQNLNTYGALAFGATTLIDFTYNTGASTLFSNPGGDSNPTSAYAIQATLNRQARNLGKSMVHLTALNNHANGGDPTIDIMFIRGKHETTPGSFAFNDLPVGFIRDPQATASEDYSDWVSQRNDPYIAGWVVNNLGTKNNGLRGDVIITWLKPLDASADNPNDVDDQLYLLITNGLTGIDGTADDYRQEIKINFLSSAGATIERLNADTGQVELVPLAAVSGRRQLSIQLDGGTGQLFKFNTGDPFIGIDPSADFDSDGDADGADFMRWQRGRGISDGATRGEGDANFDLGVDSADLSLLSSAFGKSPGTVALVPEPVAGLLSLWAFTWAILLGRVR